MADGLGRTADPDWLLAMRRGLSEALWRIAVIGVSLVICLIVGARLTPLITGAIVVMVWFPIVAWCLAARTWWTGLALGFLLSLGAASLWWTLAPGPGNFTLSVVAPVLVLYALVMSLTAMLIWVAAEPAAAGFGAVRSELERSGRTGSGFTGSGFGFPGVNRPGWWRLGLAIVLVTLTCVLGVLGGGLFAVASARPSSAELLPVPAPLVALPVEVPECDTCLRYRVTGPSAEVVLRWHFAVEKGWGRAAYRPDPCVRQRRGMFSSAEVCLNFAPQADGAVMVTIGLSKGGGSY